MVVEEGHARANQERLDRKNRWLVYEEDLTLTLFNCVGKDTAELCVSGLAICLDLSKTKTG